MTVEGIKGKWLGESVSHNIARGKSGEEDLFFFDTLTNIVKTNVNVFCSSTHDRIISDVNRSLVVAMKGDGIGYGEADFSEE